MQNVNYNREIRKFLNNSYFNLNYVLKELNIENKLDIYNTIFILLYEAQNNPIYEVIVNNIYMTGYQDLYLKLKRKEKNNTLSSNDKKFLNILKEIKTTSDLVKLPVKDQNIMKNIIEAMVEFCNKDIYQKIITIKSIDSNTRERISNINSLFYQDVENYDIDVSLDFIKDKINSARKIYSEEKLLIDAGNFIKQLIKINDKNGIRMLCELVEEDIKFLNYHLKNGKLDITEMDEELKYMYDRYKYYLSNPLDKILESMKVYEIGELIKTSIFYENDIIYVPTEKIDERIKNKLLMLNEIKKV